MPTNVLTSEAPSFAATPLADTLASTHQQGATVPLLPTTRLHSLHRLSGITLALFIGVHLSTHLTALISIAANLEAMRLARLVYRNPFVEGLLLLAIVVQAASGIALVRRARKQGGIKALPLFERLRVFSGLYLAFFLLAHTFAVLVLGRFVLNVDTNFYFGSYVLVMVPIFYVPYYALGVMSVFVHIASVHRSKIALSVGVQRATTHAWAIITLGAVVTALILLAYGGALYSIEFPQAYKMFG